MPSLSSGALLALALLAAAIPSDAVKWPFKPPAPVGKKQVKVSFDDESLSFWDPFKNTAFNASATITPIAADIGRRAPGYVAYATLATGLGLFLPPKGMIAVNIAYVAAAVARSHEGVETFCKDEGRVLLGCPSLHLALVGSALRALRFRVWRGLFVRATLFRLRYQLRFMRIYQPQWVTKGASPLGRIMQDTAHAARSVQGLFPDLCHQAALAAGGCRLPYWSDCRPPPRVEKGWIVNRRLDRRLKREFGTRARRVRPGDDYPLGLGLLGWRIPHRVLLGAARVGGRLLASPARRSGSARKRPPRRPRGSRRRRGKAEEGARLIAVLEQDTEQEEGVVLEVYEETVDENAGSTEDAQSESSQQETPGSWNAEAAAAAVGAVPTEGPLVRFHNVTAIPSRGSTLTKSYRALAELPYGDGRSAADDAAKTKSAPAWAAPDPYDKPQAGASGVGVAAPVSPTRQPLALQPVVIKRNLGRQLLLAEDDVTAARKVLRRMAFKAEIDLDLSGVLAEVVAAVARAKNLRYEAENIDRIRQNLKRAGMLGSAVGVPEVLSCPELGPLARRGIVVTTALRGVDVSDVYLMEHAAARGGKERDRFVDGVFAVFGQMCLADGCFPSNPMPENLLYMYSGQVGLTDLSSVTQLTEDQRRALCRLYRTMAELRGEDATSPSAAAELKARAAMEGVGLVIDLPPAGGIAWVSSDSAEDWTTEEAATAAVASAAESIIDATLGDEPGDDADEKKEEEEATVEGRQEGTLEERNAGEAAEEEKEEVVEEDEEEEREEGKAEKEELPEPTPPLAPRAPVTHLMLLRALFDTQQDEALDVVGGGGGRFLRSMAVRRLPQAMAPVLRMVANLRGVCAHLDVDKSLLPRFSRAASKGLSWRLALASSRGGGGERDRRAGMPPGPPSAVNDAEKPAPASPKAPHEML